MGRATDRFPLCQHRVSVPLPFPERFQISGRSVRFILADAQKIIVPDFHSGRLFGTTTSHLDIDRLSSEELIKNAVRQQYENLKSDFSRYELSIVWNRPLNHTFTLSTDIGWQHCRFRNHNYSDRITVGCSLKF